MAALPWRVVSRAFLAYPRPFSRHLSTLQNNPHVFIFPNPKDPTSHTLSLLPTNPPTSELSIGTTTKLPPNPKCFQQSPRFLSILQSVLSQHAHMDPDAISQAQVMVSTAGANLGSGGVLFSPKTKRKGPKNAGDSAGGASAQGGAGSGGRGGWIHISDSRNPPEYGRIASPEDIFGSLEVDAEGNFVGNNGNYQDSGTYRILTRNGILGLSPFLREKLVQRLKSEELGAQQ